MKLIVLFVFLSLVSAVVLARDLHSVAKKERARRSGLRSNDGSRRSFTNEDLEIYADHRRPDSTVEKRRAPLGPARDLAKEESYWQQEKDRHERDLARVDARIRKLESRLRDHRLKRRLTGGRLREDPSASLIEESLESLREERQKLVMDFREHARKAGAFPGWLR